MIWLFIAIYFLHKELESISVLSITTYRKNTTYRDELSFHWTVMIKNMYVEWFSYNKQTVGEEDIQQFDG